MTSVNSLSFSPPPVPFLFAFGFLVAFVFSSRPLLLTFLDRILFCFVSLFRFVSLQPLLYLPCILPVLLVREKPRDRLRHAVRQRHRRPLTVQQRQRARDVDSPDVILRLGREATLVDERLVLGLIVR